MTRSTGTGVMAACALLAAVTIGGCGAASRSLAPTPPGSVAEARTREVVVLGDSLAVSPTNDESFPAVLQQRIADQGLTWSVTNAGVRGDTTTGGVRRVNALLDDDVGVLVVALGANDGLRGVGLSTIERNLSTIIEAARARGIAVLLCGMETPPLHGLEYSLRFHSLFPRLASKYDIPFVPFLLNGVALNPDLNERDGIHPNGAGAARIAETVWVYLEPLLSGAAHGSGLREGGSP